MDTNHIYSSSLKRMLGYKLFPTINPQQMFIRKNNQGASRGYSRKQLLQFAENKKTDQQMRKIKKEITQAKRKQLGFEKQIDGIVNKMVDEGFAKVTENKVRKHGSSHRLRIVTQPNQDLGVKNHKKIQQQKDEEKLPSIKNTYSYKKLTSYRLKTQAQLSAKQQLPDTINAQKYIKHYRAGMSSLKKLKIKPLP